MGFLEKGTPLEWKDSLKHLRYVRMHGIEQFINIFQKVKAVKKPDLLWGDEIEYHLVEFSGDTEGRRVDLVLQADKVIEELEREEEEKKGAPACAWRPEYGSWMIEGTPGAPYGGKTSDLLDVENNMKGRRRKIYAKLQPRQAALSMVAFPLMGVGTFTTPPTKPGGRYAKSSYLPDACISPHPRFGTLTANIRRRRGRRVTILVPLYKDRDTDMTARGPSGDGVPLAKPSDTGSDTKDEEALADSARDTYDAALPAHIHMDAMGFGMGCCCLQVTFQARDLAESRYLYDQLAVLAPLLMALTAASPLYRGRLANTDTRWDVISDSVDCRTPKESLAPQAKPLPWQLLPNAANSAAGGNKPLPKSRYASISCFLSDSEMMKDEYNDIYVPIDEEAKQRLKDAGLDERLATHIAHLFTRDPLVIFNEKVKVDDEKSTEHFENIQSTNWQSVRWKPPPPNSDVGWRVEIRTMEVQITDFENAAFTIFIALLSRAILFFRLNLYMPISKVDANMERAKERQAAHKGRFFFRRAVVPLAEECGIIAPGEDPDVCDAMSLTEILSGKGEEFPGLIPLIHTYLDIIGCDPRARSIIDTYLRFISDRARGALQTNATWIRSFVTGHPEYKKDSVVSPAIAHDLLKAVDDISAGKKAAPEMLGLYTNVPTISSPKKLVGHRLRGSSYSEEPVSKEQCAVIKQLLENYAVQSNFQDTPAFLPFLPIEPLNSSGGGGGSGQPTQ